MPHLFRTADDRVWRASQPIPLFRVDGSECVGIWGGSAQGEKLKWWLSKPGNELLQTAPVAGVAVRDDDTDEVRWGETPDGVRLFFVLEAPVMGKTGEAYRIAKMVTAAATPAQFSYFRDERFALLGVFNPDGTIKTVEPLQPPQPEPPAQGELF